jgi:hypothetical protein
MRAIRRSSASGIRRGLRLGARERSRRPAGVPSNRAGHLRTVFGFVPDFRAAGLTPCDRACRAISSRAYSSGSFMPITVYNAVPEPMPRRSFPRDGTFIMGVTRHGFIRFFRAPPPGGRSVSHPGTPFGRSGSRGFLLHPFKQTFQACFPQNTDPRQGRTMLLPFSNSTSKGVLTYI